MNLITRLGQKFTVYSNQYHPVKEILNGKEIFYDYNVHKYETTIQAYIQKRRIQKNEIPAKIYIIRQLQQLDYVLKIQKLVPMNNLYDMSRMEKMFTNSEINSQYIISITLEEHFKNMMDEYLSKVVISGYTPKLSQIEQYNKTKECVIQMYKAFFYGDKQTQLEYEIEFRYLHEKYFKFVKYMEQEKPKDKCIWTYSQQKRLDSLRNWRDKDLNLFDEFRPIYEPVNLDQRLIPYQNIMNINNQSFLRKLAFKLFQSKIYTKNNKQFFTFITELLMIRTNLYIESLEFTIKMNVPADFHIEHSVVNMHYWMLMDRLQKINTMPSKFMAKYIEQKFQIHTQQKVFRMHLKRKNEFIKDINMFMKNIRRFFDEHFNKNYSQNPYHKIDALVWSTVFFEKVDRYADEVYLMSEYFIQNYKQIQYLNFESFEQCLVHFDVYLMNINYKKKILQFSPQLDEKEFKNELEKKGPKKFYYSYKENTQLPIDDDIVQNKGNKTEQKTLFSFLRKYQIRETQDHQSEREEKAKEKKYANDSDEYKQQQEESRVDKDDLSKKKE